MPHFEIKGRSVVKALTWKLIALSLTWLILYYFSGKAGESFKIAIIVAPISLVAYYFHERIWNRVHWGKESRNHNHY
ncbi:MAG: DUF2061 domain-containing protein [Candidatus Yanofskybacteria bacterium]|nr:DUF2061 domain-containing protein [Candidatus Yanofskybacteria bacterium]